jgi:hypothetical protein
MTKRERKDINKKRMQKETHKQQIKKGLFRKKT